MERPTLGTWFTISAYAIKGGEPMESTEWLRVELAKPVKGMFIGWRTCYNGVMEMAYEQESWEHPRLEYGKYFSKTENVELWLFVVNARQNPIRVFPSDATG